MNNYKKVVALTKQISLISKTIVTFAVSCAKVTGVNIATQNIGKVICLPLVHFSTQSVCVDKSDR